MNFVKFCLLGLALIAWCGAAATLEETQTPVPAYVTNSIYYKRWLWHHQDRLLPDGHEPHGMRERALQQISQTKKSASFTPNAVVPGNAWVPIGPAPILNGQTSGSQPVSGRIGDIAVNPSNYNHWVIGTAQGGLWETVNAGVTWKAKTDDQVSLAFGAVAFAPSATNIIYAGTGEEVFSADAVAGAGFLKSTNSGSTWQLLAAGTFSGTTFSVIRVHPTNPNVLLTSTARGIYKSVDGGVSWSQKRSGTGTDIEVDSGNFTNQYCAIGSTGGSAANGIYRSTNLGDTWSLVSGPWSSSNFVGRIEIAISPSSPATLYVAIANSSTSGLLGMWRTDNAWDPTPIWTQLPDPGSGFTGQLWYDLEIIVDPTNPNIIYAGGVTFKKFNGTSWTDILSTMHVDFHAVAWAGTRLIIGNDGGLWSTVNGGNSYVNHNTNLQLTQFYRGSISPSNPNFALGGSQDNGTARWDGTNGWRLILGGDGADNAISSANPSLYWAASFQDLEIRRTRNGGSSFDDATAGIGASGRPFICRFEKAPHNDDIFITGTSQIWKSINFFSGASVAWSSNSPDFGAGFRSVAFARSDVTDNTYACGFSGGPMRITTDGGATWRDLDPLGSVPNRSVYDLAFNPTNANILYACLSGLSGGSPANVYKTSNALSPTPTWVNVSYPADISANTMAMDQDDPNIIYVGTDIGVWKTANGGGNWTHMGPEVGMPNVEVDQLRLNNLTGRLVAFTHGRGAFSLVEANSLNLALSQSLDLDPASIGCNVTYTLTVINHGPLDATGLVVTNHLPANTSFSSAGSSQGSIPRTGQVVIFNLGTLPASSNATMTIVATATAAGSLTNTANVKSSQTDIDPSDNISTRISMAVVDTGPPTLLSASAQSDGSSVLLTFSEPLSSSGLDPSHYTLTSVWGTNIPITLVQFSTSPGQVILSANLLEGLPPFVISVSGLADCASNPMGATQMNLTLPAFTLVPAGSIWRYLDNGSDQGTAWRSPSFNDNSWSAGGAQLGYGDGDELTVLDYGPDPNNKYRTYYFRHAFYVPEASPFTNLIVRLLRDDGGVVYLNGVEIFRSNMPGGTVNYLTLASTTVNVPDESAFYTTNVNPSSLLVTGTNVLAVEIHQSSVTSSDISFDLELAGQVTPVFIKPFILSQPQSQTAVAGDDVAITVTVTNIASLPITYRWRKDNVNYQTNILNQRFCSLILTNVQPNQAGSYVVAVTNQAGAAPASSAAILTVLADTDGDHMPDYWEIAYGLSITNAADASGDLDGDGMTNLQEYLAGTDPTDPQSYLKIQSVQLAEPSRDQLFLTFNAVSNRTYTLQSRADLTAGTWSNLFSISARTTNWTAVITNQVSAPPDARFYRLRAP